MEDFVSWISIDKTKCDNCGTCVSHCPRCYTNKTGETEAKGDNKKCILCGHCVALCPNMAITHTQLEMSEFHSIEDINDDDILSLDKIITRRRSHRIFEKRNVPKELLEELISIVRFAPTGANTQAVEIKVIQNKERIREISKATVNHFVSLMDNLNNEAKKYIEKNETIPDSIANQIKRNERYKNMGLALEKGIDPIFHKAPVLMIFHASKKSRTPKDDCVIAAHTAALKAITMGLESCYIGLFTRAATESKTVLEATKLQKDNKVYSALILGFPVFKFLRQVARPPINTSWE